MKRRIAFGGRLDRYVLAHFVGCYLLAACVLGGVIGFVPGFSLAPGLMIALILLLIVINANLLAAILVGALGELASLAAAGVSFKIGGFLLDGPTQPIFKSMINAPVLAFFGFEYYTVTGGMVLGIVFGLLCGVVMLKSLSGFRKKMASIEEGSETYQRLQGKLWFRLMAFIFFGKGKGKKKSWDELQQKKIGLPVRPVGVVFALFCPGADWHASI